MKKYYCNIHKLDIIVYDFGEEHYFIDDNKKEAAIFCDIEGHRYLKRYVMNKCDENCLTIQNLLEEI